MTLTGLRVTAALGAPVETDHEMHLDGLLTEVAYRRLPHGRDVSRQTTLGDLPDLDIPLGRIRVGDDWVWASSAWQFSADAERVPLQVVKRKDAEDLDRLTCAWTQNSGPGRNMLVRSIGIIARSVSWVCVGNRREVRKALELVSSVGRRRRHGNGVLVGEWVVEEADVDALACLVGADGRAVRHLPVAWCETVEGARVGHGATRGPYWHPGRQRAVALPGARVTLRAEVVAAAMGAERW